MNMMNTSIGRFIQLVPHSTSLYVCVCVCELHENHVPFETVLDLTYSAVLGLWFHIRFLWLPHSNDNESASLFLSLSLAFRFCFIECDRSISLLLHIFVCY